MAPLSAAEKNIENASESPRDMALAPLAGRCYDCWRATRLYHHNYSWVLSQDLLSFLDSRSSSKQRRTAWADDYLKEKARYRYGKRFGWNSAVEEYLSRKQKCKALITTPEWSQLLLLEWVRL